MTDPFDFKPLSQTFAVVGNPIAHSKSPRIHAEFAKQCNVSIDYVATTIDIGGFEQAIRHFFASGGRGLNISVPFKVEAYQLSDSVSKRAELAQAVNTWRQERDGSLYGDNTDGVGLVTDILDNLGFDLNNKRVLLLGAGGAIRGVLGPLIESGVDSIVIANRTVDKAVELANQFRHFGNITGDGYKKLEGQEFDAVINGTAASLSGDVPPLPDDVFANNALAYDMMYAKQPTSFLQWAKQRNARYITDGFGMLIEQAAAAFEIWHNVKPVTTQLIKTLR